MKHYITVIILTLCVVACGRHSKHWETLAQVESYIEERPDSALKVLQGMDTTQFHSAESKVLYALLYTQAEDKNYIDNTDDSKIRIAVDYYKNSDDEYHKMLSYYYLARIQFNNKEYSNSITSLLHAEDVAIDLGKETVHISSIEQLDSPVAGILVIFQLERMAEEYDGVTLNKLFQSIMSMLSSVNDKDTLATKLCEANYSVHPKYDEFVYEVRAKDDYIVNASFPRISRAKIPVAIAKASFDLVITEIVPYKK